MSNTAGRIFSSQARSVPKTWNVENLSSNQGKDKEARKRSTERERERKQRQWTVLRSASVTNGTNIRGVHRRSKIFFAGSAIYSLRLRRCVGTKWRECATHKLITRNLHQEKIRCSLRGGGDRFAAARGRGGGALKTNGAPLSLRGEDHKHVYSLTWENLMQSC